MFKNKMLKKIFGPKRDELNGKFRILHNEEYHDLYRPSNIVRTLKSRKLDGLGM
jgi:hypothetical protein